MDLLSKVFFYLTGACLVASVLGLIIPSIVAPWIKPKSRVLAMGFYFFAALVSLILAASIAPANTANPAQNLFGALALLSILGAIVGLVRPAFVTPWSKSPGQGKAFGGYAAAFLVFLIGLGVASGPADIESSAEDNGESLEIGDQSPEGELEMVADSPGKETSSLATETELEQLSLTEPEPEAAVDRPNVGHFYVFRDGNKYGYQPVTSSMEATAGQSAIPLIMAHYFGRKGDTYQVDLMDGPFHNIVQCDRPCGYLKIMTFYKNEHERTEYIEAKFGTVAWTVLQDAMNGKLEIHTVEQNTSNGRQPHYIWADENKGPMLTPVADGGREQ